MNELRILAIEGVGEVIAGDDLVALFLEAFEQAGHVLGHHDVIIVTSKVVSKSEGRVVDFDGTDENRERLIAQESTRVLRRRGPLRITQTPHGFINANAGIDHSNTKEGTAVLLPKDPDRSARRFRGDIARRRGSDRDRYLRARMAQWGDRRGPGLCGTDAHPRPARHRRRSGTSPRGH